MAVSPGFAAFVVEQLGGCGPIATKRMFGGLGIYCDDLFFALIDDDVLYLKVDDSTRPALMREGGRPFRPYGDDRESTQYYSVPVSILEDADELTRWGRNAIAVSGRRRAGASGARRSTRQPRSGPRRDKSSGRRG